MRESVDPAGVNLRSTLCVLLVEVSDLLGCLECILKARPDRIGCLLECLGVNDLGLKVGLKLGQLLLGRSERLGGQLKVDERERVVELVTHRSDCPLGILCREPKLGCLLGCRLGLVEHSQAASRGLLGGRIASGTSIDDGRLCLFDLPGDRQQRVCGRGLVPTCEALCCDERIGQLAVCIDGSSCGTLGSCDLFVGSLLGSLGSAGLCLGLFVQCFDLRLKRSLLLLGCLLCLLGSQRAVGLQLGDLLERVLVGQSRVESSGAKLCRSSGSGADVLGELCSSKARLRQVQLRCYGRVNLCRDAEEVLGNRQQPADCAANGTRDRRKCCRHAPKHRRDHPTDRLNGRFNPKELHPRADKLADRAASLRECLADDVGHTRDGLANGADIVRDCV